MLQILFFYYFTYFYYFIMAYGRRWRRYYRRYYKSRYSSANKLKLSRNFKASANNMTQGGTFNISVHTTDQITITATHNASFKPFNLPSKISASEMHRYLSNVFDQYRIEKLNVKIRPLGDSITSLGNPAILFTCVDRTGFAAGADISTIKTYGSYRETMVSGSKDVSPTHYVAIGASNLVEFSAYTDTKRTVTFPNFIWGMYFAGNVTNNVDLAVSIEVDAQVRYRGVRLDTGAVATQV